jgi:hypothetical protein
VVGGGFYNFLALLMLLSRSCNILRIHRSSSICGRPGTTPLSMSARQQVLPFTSFFNAKESGSEIQYCYCLHF